MKGKNLFTGLRKILLEMVPVILGIWIALWANNCNERQKDTKFLENVLTSIRNENSSNLEKLGEVLPLQKRLLDSINASIGDSTVTILRILNESGGFKFPTINITSWEALVTTKPDLVDYKLISILSDIEEEKRVLQNKNEYATSFLYQNLNASGEDEKRIFSALIGDVIDSENTLENYILMLNELQL